MERVRAIGSQQQPGMPPSSPRPAAGPSVSSKVLVIVLVVAGLVILGGLFFSVARAFGSNDRIKSDQYQAVFLTNGQVYFGRLEDINKGYAVLRDIYYLQVAQATTEDNKRLQEGSDNADPQISLAKLGNELHGPEDEMYISRDQVLFWENLKGDGQVVKAISEFAANQETNQ